VYGAIHRSLEVAPRGIRYVTEGEGDGQHTKKLPSKSNEEKRGNMRRGGKEGASKGGRNSLKSRAWWHDFTAMKSEVSFIMWEPCTRGRKVIQRP